MEFELYGKINDGMGIDERPNQIKKKELRESIKRLSEDIKNQKILMSELSIEYNEFVKKREELKVLVSKYSNEPLGQTLNIAFQNYLIELENLQLEQKKIINIKTLKSKEIKVSKLIDQLKLRDQLIEKIRNELNKKGIKLKPDENLKTLENLNIEDRSFYQMVPSNQQVVSNPQNSSSKKISQISPKNNVNNNFGMIPIKINNSKSKSRSNSPREFNYQAYKNPNIKKERVKIRTKTTELIDRAKRNDLNEIRMHIINDMYPNSKIVYLNRRNNRIKYNNSISIQTNLGVSGDSFNSSKMSLNKSHSSNLNDSFREREIVKKVKNSLLRKNPMKKIL